MKKFNSTKTILTAAALAIAGILTVTFSDIVRAEGASKYNNSVAPPPKVSIVEIKDVGYSELFLIVDEETGNHYIAYGDYSGESACIIPRLNGQEYYVEDID